jgi:hypothetical protein
MIVYCSCLFAVEGTTVFCWYIFDKNQEPQQIHQSSDPIIDISGFGQNLMLLMPNKAVLVSIVVIDSQNQ